jgi:hypothetical protein
VSSGLSEDELSKMSNVSIVIVLGAGASKEFGLPTGAELKARISEFTDIGFDNGSRLVRGDGRTVSALLRMADQASLGRDINPYLQAGWAIRDNMPLAPSIDNFLDTRRDNRFLVDFGKLAIAGCILHAESNSKLYVDKDNVKNVPDFNSLSSTWLGQMFTILVAGRTLNDFLDRLDTIAFISFNYDRCVHQFFWYAVRSYFSTSDEEAKRAMARLHIIYPYGNVSDFNPQFQGFTNFGSIPERLEEVAPLVRTFTEGSNSSFSTDVAAMFESARLVFFLGFGFLPLNMKLLLSDQMYEVEGVYATGKGLSKSSRRLVREEIGRSFKRRIFIGQGTYDLGENDLCIEDMSCADLVYEHRRLLLGAP